MKGRNDLTLETFAVGAIQNVSASDVATAVAMVRRKFCNPAADAAFDGLTALSVMLVSGSMNSGTCRNLQKSG